jgi:hypothetical protein
MRQGAHHAAHASNKTGRGERSTTSAKVPSVTTTGPSSATGSGAWQRPHFGVSPYATFARGTRFVAPHFAQRTSAASAMRRAYRSGRRGIKSWLSPCFRRRVVVVVFVVVGVVVATTKVVVGNTNVVVGNANVVVGTACVVVGIGSVGRIVIVVVVRGRVVVLGFGDVVVVVVFRRRVVVVRSDVVVVVVIVSPGCVVVVGTTVVDVVAPGSGLSSNFRGTHT